jgi:putative transcriptional regulator
MGPSGMLLALLLAAAPGPGAALGPGLSLVTTGPPSDRPARGKLLVALPGLRDPNFAHTVVLLVAHGPEEGTMGVIVNQPLDIPLADVLPGIGRRRDRLWRGGPVLPTSLLTLVRGGKPSDDTEVVFGDVRMVTSRAGFQQVMDSGIPPERVRAFAGHAGWAPGQLEAELAHGDWALMPATTEVVFSDRPADVWSKLMNRASGEWTRLHAPERVAQAG